jgi:hypothetical protein
VVMVLAAYLAVPVWLADHSVFTFRSIILDAVRGCKRSEKC